MSIINKIIKKVAIIAAVDKVSEIEKNLSNKLEVKNKDNYFEKPDNATILVINQRKYTWKDKFDVYDENKNVKYTVKGKFTSLKHQLRIYDIKGNKIAIVKEKLFAFRGLFSFESKPINLVFEIGGKKLGKIKSKWAFGKKKFDICFNGWSVEGNIFGRNYNILNEKEKIAEISKKILCWGDTYIAIIPNPDNELMVLMIALSLDIASAPKKSEELRRTRRKKLM